MNKNVLWITRTAVFTAILIATQALTASLGNTLVTGSAVNLILIVSVMTCGLASGLTVACVSPIFAKLFGIGPLWTLIPFIMLGNVALCAIWRYVGRRNMGRPYMAYVAALITAAVAKFAVLYVGAARIAVPYLARLPEPQATLVANMFSIPQLFTALIGGGLATLVLPLVKNALGPNTRY